MPGPDLYTLIACERGMPPGWRWYSLKVIGDPRGPREHAAALVEGAVPGVRFKSGQRKGEINWAKSTGRGQLVITFADLDARRDRWEVETGTCGACGGDRVEVFRVACGGVRETRPCRRCKGSGEVAS